MGENRIKRYMNDVLDKVGKKFILTEEEIKGIFEKAHGEIVLPVSIFNSRLGMLEAASVYLKDKKGFSFKETSRILHRDYKTIWTSYNKGKVKNEKG